MNNANVGGRQIFLRSLQCANVILRTKNMGHGSERLPFSHGGMILYSHILSFIFYLLLFCLPLNFILNNMLGFVLCVGIVMGKRPLVADLTPADFEVTSLPGLATPMSSLKFKVRCPVPKPIDVYKADHHKDLFFSKLVFLGIVE